MELDVIIRGDAGRDAIRHIDRTGWAAAFRAGRSMVSKNSRGWLRVAHQAGVEFIDQHADGDVQFGQREEAPVTQPRQGPSAARSGRRPRPWPCRAACAARRHDGRAVMGGEVLIGSVYTASYRLAVVTPALRLSQTIAFGTLPRNASALT